MYRCVLAASQHTFQYACGTTQERSMTDTPQIWHYGLIARWWGEFGEPDPDELATIQQR